MLKYLDFSLMQGLFVGRKQQWTKSGSSPLSFESPPPPPPVSRQGWNGFLLGWQLQGSTIPIKTLKQKGELSFFKRIHVMFTPHSASVNHK